MASGFGWSGGRSKCYTDWQEFVKCYVESGPNECGRRSAAYLDCLHNRKWIEHATAIQAEYIRQKVAAAKAGHEVAGISFEGTSAGVDLTKDSPEVDTK